MLPKKTGLFYFTAKKKIKKSFFLLVYSPKKLIILPGDEEIWKNKLVLGGRGLSYFLPPASCFLKRWEHL